MAAERIRIADLARPVLSDVQRGALAAAAKLELPLDEDALLAAARERTGLDDFGADDFRPRLRVWLEALREDDNASPIGRLTAWSDVLRYLVSRLRIEDAIRRHPEIGAEEIARPIIVVGLPRSGTTHLVNLIAADPRLRSMPYWESREPVPIPGDGAGADGVDPRYLRAERSWRQLDATLPLLRAMHPMTPSHVHEEIELQASDFGSYVLEWIAHVPRLRDHYLAHDQTPTYAYMKRALQVLQWQRRRERWVLKSPQHLEQLGPLLATFPDATIALTVRDPVSVIASTVTMEAYGARLRCREVKLARIAGYWCDRVETLLRRCVRDLHLVPEERRVLVPFHEFMADDLGMLARIYERAGLALTPAARAPIEAYREAHPRGVHGQVVYDLKADFGLDPDALRERFGFYFERFPARAETG